MVQLELVRSAAVTQLHLLVASTSLVATTVSLSLASSVFSRWAATAAAGSPLRAMAVASTPSPPYATIFKAKAELMAVARATSDAVVVADFGVGGES